MATCKVTVQDGWEPNSAATCCNGFFPTRPNLQGDLRMCPARPIYCKNLYLQEIALKELIRASFI